MEYGCVDARWLKVQILVNVSVFRTNFVTIQVVFVNILNFFNRIFTLVLHYSCIPSYNNIVKIFSTRPAVAGLIKKVQLQLD